MSARALLAAHPSFMRFWWARMAGTLGAQMLAVALGWQMYALSGSAFDLGLVGLVQFVPALALTLVAGAVVDRHDRRRIFAACLMLQTAVALVLAAAAAGGWASRGLLLAVALGLGVARAFQMPASQALTPQLVPPLVLPRALALASGGLQASVIAGPALGGVLYVAGAAVVYAVAAAMFVVGAVLMQRLRLDHELPRREAVGWRGAFAGFAFIWRRKDVLGAVSLDLFAVLLGGATALLPIFVRDILHAGPSALGLLRAAPAVGALAMSVALVRWPIERRVGRVMFGAVAVYGVATLVFAMSHSLWLSFVALAVSGAGDMVSVVIRQSLVQLDTPDAMRGRVAAVNSVFIGASNQLGDFRAGALAAGLGAVGSVLVGAAGTLVVVALWWRLFPSLARREQLLAASP